MFDDFPPDLNQEETAGSCQRGGSQWAAGWRCGRGKPWVKGVSVSQWLHSPWRLVGSPWFVGFCKVTAHMCTNSSLSLVEDPRDAPGEASWPRTLECWEASKAASSIPPTMLSNAKTHQMKQSLPLLFLTAAAADCWWLHWKRSDGRLPARTASQVQHPGSERCPVASRWVSPRWFTSCGCDLKAA